MNNVLPTVIAMCIFTFSMILFSRNTEWIEEHIQIPSKNVQGMVNIKPIIFYVVFAILIFSIR